MSWGGSNKRSWEGGSWDKNNSWGNNGGGKKYRNDVWSSNDWKQNDWNSPRNGTGGGRGKKGPPPTKESLDADLDAYFGKTPPATEKTVDNGKSADGAVSRLDEQLESYFGR